MFCLHLFLHPFWLILLDIPLIVPFIFSNLSTDKNRLWFLGCHVPFCEKEAPILLQICALPSASIFSERWLRILPLLFPWFAFWFVISAKIQGKCSFKMFFLCFLRLRLAFLKRNGNAHAAPHFCDCSVCLLLLRSSNRCFLYPEFSLFYFFGTV